MPEATIWRFSMYGGVRFGDPKVPGEVATRIGVMTGPRAVRAQADRAVVMYTLHHAAEIRSIDTVEELNSVATHGEARGNEARQASDRDVRRAARLADLDHVLRCLDVRRRTRELTGRAAQSDFGIRLRWSFQNGDSGHRVSLEY